MTEKKFINLLRGWPAPSLLAAEQLRTAAATTLADPTIFVPGLQYGADPGYEPLRDSVAAWLARAYAVDTDPERICVSGGASQSLACVLQSFTDPAYTRAVWVIAPCYYLACPIFEDAGFRGRLRAVPEDEEGIELERLADGLASFEGKGPDRPAYKHPQPERKVYKHIIYCVPTCANPSGKSMTLRRRQGLVELARKYDALIICDDVYDFLQWPAIDDPTLAASLALPMPLLPRLVDVDRALGPSEHDPPGMHFGHAISNGSFSKLLGPGVRTGWVEGTRHMAYGMSQTGSTRSGGAPSQLAAMLIHEIVQDGGLEAHLRDTVRPALQARHATLVRAVRRELDGLGAEVRASSEAGKASYGGYFVWVTLPAERGVAAAQVAERALQEESLIIAPGNLFEVYGDEEAARFTYSFRLAFSWEGVESLEEGVRRLGRVLRRLYEEAGEDGGRGGYVKSSMNEFK